MSSWKPAVITVVHIMLYLLLVAGVYFFSWRGYHFCENIFGVVQAAEVPGQDFSFQVKSGDNFAVVAERLEREGIIKDKYSFYIRARLMDSRRIVLRSGKYILNNSMTYEQIINRLTVSEGTE